jgi:hypothetical protein
MGINFYKSYKRGLKKNTVTQSPAVKTLTAENILFLKQLGFTIKHERGNSRY